MWVLFVLTAFPSPVQPGEMPVVSFSVAMQEFSSERTCNDARREVLEATQKTVTAFCKPK